jgi:arabinogalactan oligomer / maltooligosaccharide transport system substrate-binding protein
MKRKLIAILIVTLLVGSLFTACGTKKNGQNPGTTGGASATAAPTAAEGNGQTGNLTTEPVTLKVWESTGGPDQFIKQAGDAFTKKYPNIKIEYVNVELGDAASQIALDGPAGVGPDLFAAPHDKLGELVTGGHVLPTENSETVKGSALAACSTAITYDNTMYGYPVSAETYALFYNKDLIAEDQVPKTWEEVVTFSEKFNKDHKGKYGFMMDVGNGYYTIIFTTSNNNRLFGPTGTDTANTNINSEASVKGMQFFQSLRKILDVPAADLTTSICDTAFSSGNSALYITGLWNVANFEKAGVKFGVAPLPSLPGNTTPAASFSGTRVMFVSAYSNYPAEASAFGQFLMSDEMQKLRFDITGALPSTNITVNSPYIAGFTTQMNYAFPMPSIPQMGAYWDAMNAASANIWDGKDVKKELDACNTTILGK